MTDTIYCPIRGKETSEHFITHFYDKDNKYRYGAVCSDCHKDLQKHKKEDSKPSRSRILQLWYSGRGRR